MHKLIGPIALAAAIASAVSPARAEEVTVTVSYADLDLTNPDDVSTLHARLADAFRDACATTVPHTDAEMRVNADCVRSGLANGAKVISQHRDRALETTP